MKNDEELRNLSAQSANFALMARCKTPDFGQRQAFSEDADWPGLSAAIYRYEAGDTVGLTGDRQSPVLIFLLDGAPPKCIDNTGYDNAMRGNILNSLPMAIVAADHDVVYAFEDEATVGLIMVDGDVLKQEWNRAMPKGAQPAIRHTPNLTVMDPTLAGLAKIVLTAVSSRQTISARVASGIAQAVAMHLLNLYTQAPSVTKTAKPSAVVQRVMNYVDANLRNPLSLEELGKVAGVSRFHLARIFKSETGETLHAYVTHRRIAAAQIMLVASDATIIDAALSLGFSSQSHFTTTFRKVTGQTPGQYRRSRKPKDRITR